MSPELLPALLVFLVSIVGLLMLFIDRSSKRTMEIARAVIYAAEAFAKMTPDPRDDEQVARLKQMVLGETTPAAAQVDKDAVG